MGRFTSDNGGGFTPAPEGTHVARCIRLIDLGTQHGEYLGQASVRNQVMVIWELPNTKMPSDGLPFTISGFYTNSLNEKANLRKSLESWRGRKFTADELKKFDLESVLGKTCMLQVIHNENGRAKIQSIMALPAGTVVPKQVNPSQAFWIEGATQELFDNLSDGIKAIIEKSDEWQARKKKPATAPAAAVPASNEAEAAPEPAPDVQEITEEAVPF